MKKNFLAIAPCIALALFVSACGSDDSKPEATSTRSGPSVKAMSSRYGKVIFDARGRALYLFTRDRTSRSRCYGECASRWPPFLTSGRSGAGKGARSKLLGTTKRRDGKTQVTYRGHALYYYEGDREPGQILCQDVDEFGGTWLVISPSGNAVR